MNIFDHVKSLNLPFGEYVVIGSGVMSAHGIRQHKDVDLLVTPALYETLKKDGWTVKQVRHNFEVVIQGDFEAGSNMVSLPGYHPDIAKLIQNADIINEVAFTKLADVIEFKKALGRSKDFEDITLIEKHLGIMR